MRTVVYEYEYRKKGRVKSRGSKTIEIPDWAADGREEWEYGQYRLSSVLEELNKHGNAKITFWYVHHK